MAEHRVILIPAEPDQEIREQLVPTVQYPATTELLSHQGTQIIERVNSDVLRSLARDGVDIIMVVDEEFLCKPPMPRNQRAEYFYPGGLILGDVLLVGEKFFGGDDPGVDFTGLPEHITVATISSMTSAGKQ